MMMTRPGEGVPPVSEERREKGIPIQVCFLLGRGPILMPGQMGSPGSFYIFIFIFFFSFSGFLISSYLLQIYLNSNQTSSRNFQ
jgi:hypothetical protein